MKERLKPTEDGYTFDSSEELHAYWWFKELKENGYIDEIIPHPQSFNLSRKFIVEYTKVMKKVPSKTIEKTIMHPHGYSCDFKIVWNKKALESVIFDSMLTPITSTRSTHFDRLMAHKLISFIEVKPVFDQNNMTRAFMINQKWVMEKYSTYINLFVPPKIFKKTFTPKRYLLTDVSKTTRKINFPIKSLQEFTNL